MHKIVINGIFYNHTLTGIERFSQEITKQLDLLSQKNEITLVLPSDAPPNKSSFKNIRIVYLPRTPGKKQFNKLKLSLYLLLTNSLCLDYTNNISYFGKNVVFLHDIYYKQFETKFTTKQDIFVMKKYCKMYKKITQKARMICTVSQYSKQKIIDYYQVPQEKIKVIYNGVDHIYNITADYRIFEKYPQLQKHPYYFTLGSLSIRKNLKWIIDHANLYPHDFFVISGITLKNEIPFEIEKLKQCKNILCVGYLKDTEVKALMERCKAFIFPSYFEGFGLPPLEALACGAKIIISNTSCLPEIYKNYAYYIQPDDPAINLDDLLKNEIMAPGPLLKKYSYRESAKKLYALLKEVSNA